MSLPFISEKMRKWWILAAMTTAVSMVFIDITVLPVALPTLSRELNFSELSLQWIINAYTLTLTVLVLVGGRLADQFGLRTVFCWGICLFAIASAMCGLGNSAEWLIFSRIIQGAGGALMLPATQAIIMRSFPSNERGKAVGIFISVGSVFLAMGPLIGGYFTEYASWRYVFWINLPIAAIGLGLTRLTVPFIPPHKQTIDLVGFFTCLVGISSIVIAIMQAQSWGWGSPLTLLCLAVGIALMFLLTRAERQKRSPLIDVALIKTPAILASLSTAFTVQFLIIITIFWTIFFQNVAGYSPAHAGGITFVANISVLFAAPIAGLCVDKFGPRFPISLGFSLLFFSLIWFVFHAAAFTVWTLLPTLLCFGIGVPFILTPSSVSFQNATPSEKRGSASGIFIATRQFSSTLGLALFGTLYSQWVHWRFSALVKGKITADHFEPRRFEGLLAHNPGAVSALKELPTASAEIVQTSLRQASLSGFYLINSAAALMALVGLMIALKWMKKKREVAS